MISRFRIKTVAIARRIAPKMTRAEELRGGLARLGVTPSGGARTPMVAKGLLGVLSRSEGGGGILEAMASDGLVEMAMGRARMTSRDDVKVLRPNGAVYGIGVYAENVESTVSMSQEALM